MGFMGSFDISASALTAQRFRMDMIANNLANAETTRTADGTPYRRQVAVFEEKPSEFAKALKGAMNGRVGSAGGGVKVADVSVDESPLKMVYKPDHPDANEEGCVMMPNVDTATEMVDMISATRSYEANVTALNATKNMALKALEIGR